jgi:RimJ/RimL family protein N-acetyltransferase
MLETERLTIRRFEETDVDQVAQMRGDKDVMRFIREPQDRDGAAEWMNFVSSRWETKNVGLCALIEKRTGEFVGWCGLWILVETGETEVGYAVAKRFWGRGFAVEASKAFLEYGFKNLDLQKIVAVTHPKNTNSRRVMEKLGMNYVGTGRFYGNKLVQYKITKDEFN